MGDVKAIGDRCLWLENGSVRELGATDAVVSKYLGAMAAKDSAYMGSPAAAHVLAGELPVPPELAIGIPNVDHRHGDGRAEVTGIALYDEFGNQLRILAPATRVIVRISVLTKAHLALPNVGFMLRNHLGVDFAGTNTTREGHQLPPMGPGDRLTVDFHVDIPELYPSEFSFSPAIADGTLLSYTICDWIDNAIAVQMGHADETIYGYMHLPCRVEVNARMGKSGVPRETPLTPAYDR
jgi:hypothetical protein